MPYARNPKPWERQLGESAKAFQAFTAYRDLDPDERSIDAAAAAIGKSASMCNKWAQKWRWRERADAWLDHLENLRDQATENEVVAMCRRHAEIAVAFQEKLTQRLQKFKVSELKPRDMSAWLDVAAKLERMARGIEGERIKAEISGPDGKPIPHEVSIDFEGIAERYADEIAEAVRLAARKPEDGGSSDGADSAG